jgi:hypothetical protein
MSGLDSLKEYGQKTKALLSPTIDPKELGAKAENISQYVKPAPVKAAPLAPNGLSSIDAVNKPGVPTKRDRLIKPLE